MSRDHVAHGFFPAVAIRVVPHEWGLHDGADFFMGSSVRLQSNQVQRSSLGTTRLRRFTTATSRYWWQFRMHTTARNITFTITLTLIKKKKKDARSYCERILRSLELNLSFNGGKVSKLSLFASCCLDSASGAVLGPERKRILPPTLLAFGEW